MLGVRAWLGPDFKPFASPQAAGHRDHDHTEAMAMRARLVLLVLVAVAAAAVRADGPPRRPDDRVRIKRKALELLPPPPGLPPGNVQPDPGWLFVGGDYFSGGLGGCRFEAGWRWLGGYSVTGSLGGPPGTSSATYQWPVWEAECTRCSAVVGTECGCCSEWAFGHGFVVQHEFLVPRPQLRACIMWFPAPFVHLRFGLDLLQWRRYWGWELSF
jgi:hypothetical protein